MKKNYFLRTLSTILTIVILSFAGAIWLHVAIAAWTGPTANAPDNNVDAPLNIGSIDQYKSGELELRGGLKIHSTGQATTNIWTDANGLRIDARNDTDTNLLVTESYIYVGGSIMDLFDNTVNIGENLAVAGTSLTVNGSEVCRQDGTNCPAAGTNNYVTGISFDTGNGVLTLARQGLGSLTQDLDGRYLNSYTETDPQVNAVTSGLWCRGTGSQITCDQAAPSAGGVGDITAVNSGVGTKGGSSSGSATIEFDCSEVDGTGISCSGETLQADTGYLQRRVSSTCPAGSSIRIINSNGTVTCETDNEGSGGGTLETTTVIKDTSSTGTSATITATCPSGWLRTGCSPLCQTGRSLQVCGTINYGSNGCRCNGARTVGIGPGTYIDVFCTAHCARIN